MGRYSLVQIEWSDIVAEVGWQDVEEKTITHPCTSVGFVLEEDPITIVLASTISSVDDKNETNNRIAIPVGTITSIKVLKVING